MDNSIVEPQEDFVPEPTTPPKKKTTYICSRCKKEFTKLPYFKDHMNRKFPCVIEYNTDYHIIKNIIQLREKYNEIRHSAMLCSDTIDTIDFDLKYKAMVKFYDKVNKLLILIEIDRNLSPSITNDMVSELKSYLNNCKTGQFD
jgi:hypothetical protein